MIVSGIGDGGNSQSGGLFVLQFNEPAYPELALDYDDTIMESSLLPGESANSACQCI